MTNSEYNRLQELLSLQHKMKLPSDSLEGIKYNYVLVPMQRVKAVYGIRKRIEDMFGSRDIYGYDLLLENLEKSGEMANCQLHSFRTHKDDKTIIVFMSPIEERIYGYLSNYLNP